jgi:pyruvate,orthophosphate dikinase
VADVFTGAVENLRIAEIDGRFSLLPAGRMIVAGEYSRHYRQVRADQKFVAAYEEFERVNETLKSVITSWQVYTVAGTQLPNDHSDQAYDDKVIDRLGRVHDRVEPLLETMSATLPRFRNYLSGLGAALERAERGEPEWVSDVQLPSYHTVWFELHEDLLCILGRTRTE